MAKVITLNDIMDMKDPKQLRLSKGTIITPSARDWASEKGITLLYEGEQAKNLTDTNDKTQLLDRLAEALSREIRLRGLTLGSDEIEQLLKRCLEKLNYQVD